MSDDAARRRKAAVRSRAVVDGSARRLRAAAARLPRDLRPLDPIGSIRAKLGLLVVASCTATALVVWLGLTRLGWQPRFTLPLGVLAALAVTQALARGMTRPLREMTAAARAMTVAGGPVAIGTASRDEVGELARAFTAMSAELADADRQRRDLLATVGHELRTPVAALRGQLENLVDGVTPSSPQALEAALGQTERLGTLVDDLLELARLEAGAVVLDRETVPLAPFLADAVAAAAAARPGRRWSVDVAPDDVVVTADPRRLRQVVGNLLDNAGRHSPAGGLVAVTAAARDGGVRLSVTDEGPGIPAADRTRVFERFSRGADDQGGGTGLGLAIARWAVDLHGGRIAVADGDGEPGQPDQPSQPGCTIHVDLPQEPDMTASPPPTAAPLLPPPPPGSAPSLAAAWPAPSRQAPVRLVLGALVAGVAAGAWLVQDVPGLNVLLVSLLVAAPVLWVGWPRLRGWDRMLVVLALLLSTTAALRDSAWLVALTMLAALGCTAVALARSWSWLQIAVAPIAWGLASLRATPWAARALRGAEGLRRAGPALRGGLVAAAAVAVFAALLASADPAFDRLVQAVVPDVQLGSLPGKAVLGVVCAVVTLGAGYIALSAPRWDRVGVSLRGDAANRGRPSLEWALPLGAVDAVVAAFVVVQAAVLFGGHDVVLAGTGVTYAERARTGFGQLAGVTALTVLLLATCVRLARREDRRLLLLLGGTLCGLSLVVVASALWRLALYEQAYGHTVARLVGGVGEVWMAVVIVACGVAAARGGAWLPRAVVTSAAVALLVLVAVSPDRWVAERNVDRLASTGDFDADYASQLSADAVPALDRLPEPYRSCTLSGRTAEDHTPDSWLTWNLARSEAAAILAARPVEPQGRFGCDPNDYMPAVVAGSGGG